MTHPIYAGYVESKAWDVSLRPGQHEATIPLATSHKVQERIAGKPLAPTPPNIHVDSPRRAFVACGACAIPLPANWPQGRNAPYPYDFSAHLLCTGFGQSGNVSTVARDLAIA